MNTRPRSTRSTVTPRIVAKRNLHRVTVSGGSRDLGGGTVTFPTVTFPVWANTKLSAYSAAADLYRRQYGLLPTDHVGCVDLTVERPTLAF